MENLPLNHRARWTEEELNKLLKQVNKNVDFKTIADNHKRTIGAIKYKLIRYAIDKSEKDQTLTLEDLLKLTKLSKDDLITGFEKLQYDYTHLIEEKENIEELDENIYLLSTINRNVRLYGICIILLQISQLILFNLYFTH